MATWGKARFSALALVGAGLLPACSDPPVGSPPISATERELLASCVGLDVSGCVQPAPSFVNDVQPLLDRDCNSSCHFQGNAQKLWPLAGYQDVRDWADILTVAVDGCSMPPLDGGVPMPAADRLTLLDWIQCGAPNN